MNIRLFVTSILLMFSSVIFAQNNYVKIPIFYDSDTEAIKTVLKQYKNSNRVLIYRPSSTQSSFCSILIIEMNNSVDYLCFRNDSILLKGNLPSNSLFQYKHYKNTGVIKTEVPQVKFVQPLMCLVENTESVIYIDNKNKFYFEYGSFVSYYKESPKRAVYRKEWLEIIRHELIDIL